MRPEGRRILLEKDQVGKRPVGFHFNQTLVNLKIPRPRALERPERAFRDRVRQPLLLSAELLLMELVGAVPDFAVPNQVAINFLARPVRNRQRDSHQDSGGRDRKLRKAAAKLLQNRQPLFRRLKRKIGPARCDEPAVREHVRRNDQTVDRRRSRQQPRSKRFEIAGRPKITERLARRRQRADSGDRRDPLRKNPGSGTVVQRKNPNNAHRLPHAKKPAPPGARSKT